ncbi:MAG: peptidoglycan-associated lipoprotein Pal [Endozoicomonas sp. (ex Botrylloides leachii)]|nr:peptidoglycan-associated lipoprotein Pal [Endozoicomonas sp. (ex Botrylloides leachii)]
MQGVKCIKVIAVATTFLWLAGCASRGENSTMDSAKTTTPATETVAAVKVTPVVDPAVQAVIDSGKVQGTPEQIQKMLNDDLFHFSFDSAQLSDSAYKALDAKAAYLTSPQGANETIIVQGHTDERGTRTYNLALGERRANAVKNYLVAKGVNASRIQVISFGFEKPLDTAHNQAAWSKNRRAVIVMS